ncbi:MAG: DUF1501 domain-containing protein [Acidimicrobiia bacterium]|nr:DUF1501 domain-containing protein [Acidimicrobiia bacterium]
MTPPEPDPRTCSLVNRRQFIAGLGATVAVTTVGGWALGVWRGRPDIIAPGTSTTMPTAGPLPTPDGRTLVIIEMGGGNDGLNMVVPHASNAYHDLRRDLAVTDPIDLDGEIGLHPNLPGLAELYGAGRLAIVEGVGYPDPELSHFTSMATWWSGDPTARGAGAGWLGKYLDLTGGAEEPLAAIVIGPGPTPALLAEHAFAVTIQDVSGLAPTLPPWIDTRDELMAAWKGFAPAGMAAPGLFGEVQRAIAASAAAAGELNTVLAGDAAGGIDSETGAGGMTGRGRDRSLAGYLDLAARLAAAENPPRVIYVHGWGDFDTHEGQQTRHGDLMAELDGALSGFFDVLDQGNRADGVLVMTTSEFGRRAAANGAGTDHGTAAAQLVIGSTVTGGRFGTPPDLQRLDRTGNLDHTVDFRSMYATVLDDWLGVGHAEVLGTGFETLGALRA